MDFIKSFMVVIFGDNRYFIILKALQFVLGVTVMATILGIILGVILTLFKLSNDLIMETKYKKLVKYNPFYIFSNIYIDIVRGTPLIIQIVLINNFVFVGDLKNTPKIYIAAIAVGLNSAAYIAEIIRSGIKGLDKGQMEAARALGMPYIMSMVFVILPQAFKNMLPTLVNEFIVLLKETSIVSYIGANDLMRAANTITSITYKGLEPLIAIAIVYLFLTTSFTYFMRFVERRIGKSD